MTKVARRCTLSHWAAGLMLCLWFVSFTLRVLPPLHQLLHADAGTSDHQCLVTTIEQESLVATTVDLAVPRAPVSLLHLRLAEVGEVPGATDDRLSPSRAPPFPAPFSPPPAEG